MPAQPDATAAHRAALEGVIRPSLARAPCVIGFSGGRDSSVLLAAAVGLARREGWDEPVPATLEFSSAATAEREWQESVLAHLHIDDWVRVRVADELDLVGPVATDGLRRHGLLYPPNAHVVVPLARQALGGSVLTGVGGDDIFGNWPWHDFAGVLARRRSLRLTDARRGVHLLSPRWVRAEVLRRREPLTLPWLRTQIRPDAALTIATELCSAPRFWAARMLWSAAWRPWRATAHSLELLGADHGAKVSCPFLEPAFLASLARAGGRLGWGDRTETMRALFADLLPDALLSRRSKAEFSEPLFGPHARRFARRWDGCSGLDGSMIRADVLRHVWWTPRPHFLSAMALQSAWLASDSAACSGHAVQEFPGPVGVAEGRW